METIIRGIEKLYNSIRYNGFYILLALAFPFIIYQLDAGGEIIQSMSEKAFGINIALSVIAFSALAFSVWCIPTCAIGIFQFVTSYKKKANNKPLVIGLFKQLINVYNGSNRRVMTSRRNVLPAKLQISIRYFAIIPWMLFVLTCTKIYFSAFLTLFFSLLIIVGLVVINQAKNKLIVFYGRMLKYSAGNINLKRYWMLITTLFLLIILMGGLLYFARKGAIDPRFLTEKYLIILLNTFFLFVFYSFVVYLENADLADKTAYGISHTNYWVLLIFLLLTLLVFFFLNRDQNIEYISPVFIIVLICATFIIFFELFFTAQFLLITIVTNDRFKIVCPAARGVKLNRWFLQGFKYALMVALLFIARAGLFSAQNTHKIRKTPAVAALSPDATDKRVALTDYFENWYRERSFKNEDSVIYLISGQGGGSRAAAHFFMTMALLDAADTNFFKNVFSISTVSGSTSGANMFLATKFCQLKIDSASLLEKTKKLYGRNYMSSAFFGLLLGDGLESFLSPDRDSPRDRNFYLQKEELKAFKQTFPENAGGNDTTASRFFENDYFYSYAFPKVKHWPLFMINSTLINFGVRGIFSPVKTDFSLARDLYGDFKKDNCNKGFDLPLVTCVNQSQAFPLLSAYNYMECEGRLGDGGFVENTGCATTLEIYQALRKYCNDSAHQKKGVRIVCINLSNGSLKESVNAPYKNASILNTLAAVANGPFEGTQVYAYKNLKKEISYLKGLNLQINQRDTAIDYSLGTSITLTRTLSEQKVQQIHTKLMEYEYDTRKRLK